MTDRSKWFVSTEWLDANLADSSVTVVDGSWHLPNTNRNAGEEYLEAHIPGAVFFDIDAIADVDNPLPHMLPTVDGFASAVGALGIEETQKIVVYDSPGLSSAPRVWWTFKIMGAPDVVILEGGLTKWRAEGRSVEAGPATHSTKTFRARFDDAAVSDLTQVRQGIADQTIQLVDARSRGRFLGEAPEPRSGVRSGRMPDSFNLPFTDIVDDGILKNPAAIAAAFDEAGIDLDRPIVTSCGSGVTAAILTLALQTIGVAKSSLYDGSWAEWGAHDDTDVITGQGGDTRR